MKINYTNILNKNMINVFKDVLLNIQKNGLQEDHHLYITFLTQDTGVEIPGHLREKFPEEMTIVVQHQFWDLKTSDTAFSIKLSCNDITEQLRIPFASITAFADPSVNFGLQFKFNQSDVKKSTELVPRSATATALMPLAPSEKEDDEVSKLSNQESGQATTSATDDDDETGETVLDEDSPGDNNVVALDTFRKK